jgi:hypothetical protein
MKISIQKLRILYSDIVRGYSTIDIPKFGRIFIKHPNHADSATVDGKTEYYLQKAKDRKLPTLAEKEEYLEQEGLWTKKDDKKLNELESYVKNLRLTKSKTLLRADREVIQKSIEENEIKIIELRRTKFDAIGFTAETYAGKKANEYFMYNSIYRDESLTAHFFTHEEFTELDDIELSAVVLKYNASQNEFNSDNMKRIAVSPFFTNLFYLCEDRSIDFYGKPVVELTFNQAELFSYGRYFKHIFSEHRANIPQHLHENPDGLIDWFERNKNAEKIMKSDKQDIGGASTIVGATEEDLSDLGYKHNVINLSKEAAKKGGSLTMDELIAIHGA